MTDDLVKRWDEYVESMGCVMGEVEHMAQQMRDRIEALERERDALFRKAALAEEWRDSDKARAEAAEAALAAMTLERERLGREVNMARYGQPDFAWSIHKEAMADLEARLDTAVDALRFYSCDNSCDDCPVSERGRISCGWTARAVLAEIEGGKT